MVKKDETRPGPTGRGLKASSGGELDYHTVTPSTNQFDYLHNQRPDHRRAALIRRLRQPPLEEHQAPGHTVFGPALGRWLDIIAEREGRR
jgi:hypothetical protein